MAVNLWVYKCNRKDQPSPAHTGDWNVVFEQKGQVEWGGSDRTGSPESKIILNDRMRPGDSILAYQTDDRALVGECRVAKLTGATGKRRLWLEVVRRFDAPVPILDLKRSNPALRKVKAFMQGAQKTLHEVTREEREVLEAVCGVKFSSAGDEFGPCDDGRASAGFGDPEENKIIEKKAVEFVRLWYERQNWKVESVEETKCGFDLLCKREGRSECVEVKGVKGSEPAFIITSSELSQAETNLEFMICIVTAALSDHPMITRMDGADLRKHFGFRALQFHATLQKPVPVRYQLRI